MNRIIFVLLMSIIGHSVVIAAGSDPEPVRPPGPYLAMDPPGDVPVIFAPGLVSTSERELNTIISPDGKEIYFSRRIDDLYVTMVCKEMTAGWTGPEITSFSLPGGAIDPAMSADGQRILFGSMRKPGLGQADIWQTERSSGGEWSEPKHLGRPVNTPANENYPTLTNDGTLYYFSKGHGGFGEADIFRVISRNGKYQDPENLGKAVNSEFFEYDPFIARDESYLIFSSSDRPDSLGKGDIYISFRRDDGSWTDARNLGRPVNSSETDYCPKVSPDGKYFSLPADARARGISTG